MVFCNMYVVRKNKLNMLSHNPYFNRWFSAINNINLFKKALTSVTILILIDGFLQYC